MPKFGKLLGGILLFFIGGFLLYKNSQTPLETIFIILVILSLIGGIYLIIRGFNYSSNLIELPKREITNTVKNKVKSANVVNNRENNVFKGGNTINKRNRIGKNDNGSIATSNLKPSSLNSNNNSKIDNKNNRNHIGNNNSKKIDLNRINSLNNNISSLNKDDFKKRNVNTIYNNYNSLNKHRLIRPKEENPKSKIDILKNSFSSSSEDEVKEFTFQPNYQKPNLVTRKPKKKEVPSHSLEDLLSAEEVNKNPKKSESENNIFDSISKYRSKQKSDEFNGPRELLQSNLIKPKIKEDNVDKNDVIKTNNDSNNISEDIAKYLYSDDNCNDYEGFIENGSNIENSNIENSHIDINTYNNIDSYNANANNNTINNSDDNNTNNKHNNKYLRPKLNKKIDESSSGVDNNNINLADISSNRIDQKNIDINNFNVNRDSIGAAVENIADTPGDDNVINIDKEFYVVCENKILSSNEAVEKLISRAKDEILLEIPSLIGLSPDILTNLSNASRIIIGEFDIKDMSYALLLSSLIKQNTEIRILESIDSINMVVDDNYGLIISGANDYSSSNESDDEEYIGGTMGVGAVFNDSESISSIRDTFNKSWDIATEIKI